ncbi:peroxide stress protein YaaA [Anaerotignum lactatifermentans]|uniref:UPF0246 protein H9X83_03235 n=1 Tax=Anaerotignum lactatifermentans TaxID=160404 RepID=A0ABS2G7J9_9FIRM|nr:peroxide stress protein YaaA [Anaerotignum lactatifermentans]MBM6829754.1 peroxide stress protein YaaA [Anaerotignum lactatifermentans]MBM6877175.1 peroxide stress protein YaaA [Anaerotignum lactatifermentans]MBM6951413.1 peroxide stress protein YaaA [Anaerotignum lactatifermentans]
MRIIISPAKKMNVDMDSLQWKELPAFLPQTERILERLREMDGAALKKLWKCSDQIAALNRERLEHMDLRQGLTPAILSYEGIQYQHMGPGVFTQRQFDYVQEHLRILSGFYGLLRPLDGVTPYRLEMGARLALDGAKNLYDFWGARLAEKLTAQTDEVLNLASKEYSQCISRHLPEGKRMVTCVFGEEKAGRIVEKGTLCKMARGEMVRFLAEQEAKTAEQCQAFSGLGFRFAPERSDEETYVFLKEPAEKAAFLW